MANNSHNTIVAQLIGFEQITQDKLTTIRDKVKLSLNKQSRRKVDFLVKKERFILRGEIVSAIEIFVSERNQVSVTTNTLLAQYKSNPSDKASLALLSQTYAFMIYTNTINELSTLLDQLTIYDFNNN